MIIFGSILTALVLFIAVIVYTSDDLISPQKIDRRKS